MAKFTPVEVIYKVQSNKKGTGLEATPVKPLVRCKDCKYNDKGFCDEVLEGKRVDEEFFCSCGTRRNYDEA